MEEALKKFRIELSKNITNSIKLLLETKHLYQVVNVDEDSCKASVNSQGITVDAFNPVTLESTLDNVINGYWEVDSHEYKKDIYTKVGVDLTGVKLFCKQCERIEPFNFYRGQDLIRAYTPYKSQSNKTIQVFSFSFLCQGCKSIPEIFIVRREGTELILSGRSPMESINVPKDIPKSIKEYYTGALLAFQSGQTLPANFMLRVLLEQWTRQVTQEPTTREIDAVIDKYMKSLPGDFTERFYSFGKLYEELSVDIHGATGSVELFEKALSEINTHFEARRLFKLSQ